LARCHFVVLTLALGALHLQSQAPKPLWELDLSRYGYQGRPPAALAHISADSQYNFEWTNQQGVAFTDPNIVAAYFVVYDAPSEPREPRISDSFRLVTVFLNAKNGEPIKQLDWTLPHDPVQVSPSFFYPAAQGRFIVILGDTVDLYSSDFKLLTQFQSHGEMSPVASPSGESLLLKTSSHYDLLDTGKLSVLKSWDEAARDSHLQLDSLWGDRFAWTKRFTLYFGTAPSESKKLLAARPESCDTLKSIGNPARPIPWCDTQDNLLTVAGNLCGGWQLIGNDSIVGPLCGDDNKLLTVSTDGKITSEVNLGLEQVDGPVIPSAKGQRFAIPTTRWGLGRNNVPDKQIARVFDLGSENQLFTVDVPSNPDSPHGFFFSNYGDTRFGWGGLALSPNGNLLAVKSGATVRIYSVPEKAAVTRCTSNCDGRDALSNPTPSHPQPTPSPASPLVERMLCWFPTDTETLMGATGPLQMPKMSSDAKGVLGIDSSPDVVRDTFQQYFLLLILRLQKEFKDASIAAALEGSRSFRPPNGLGMAGYQGAMIAVFTDDVTSRAAAFLNRSASTAVLSEQIGGQPVEVFQDKSEGNIQTTYVAFPKPDTVVVATDESYLREVLARIGGKQGQRALPNTLPEWKHVDTNAAFWAVRHYPGTEAARGSLLPPGCREGHSTDQKPVGLTFSFSPGGSNLATIDYLSGDEDYLRCISRELFHQNERGVAEMRMQYSEPQSGVLEGSYNLDEIESAQYFLLVLEALVGHPIFV
jgi:hypothetical protein